MTQKVVDWEIVLDGIRRAGISDRKLAEHLNIARSCIYQYRDGVSTPRHDVGEAIIDLWTGLTNSYRTQVPMQPKPLSAADFKSA